MPRYIIFGSKITLGKIVKADEVEVTESGCLVLRINNRVVAGISSGEWSDFQQMKEEENEKEA